MRQHLKLNQQRMETSTVTTDEIEEHRDAMEELKSRCEENSGFVRPVSQANEKDHPKPQKV